MKKFLILILSIFLFSQVEAASIKSVGISGPTSIKMGSEITLKFNIDYSDVKQGTNDTYGVVGAGFEIVFDDTIFSIIDIGSEEFDSYVYKEDNKYYIVGTINTKNLTKNSCLDGKLHCGNYLVYITFYVRDTDITTTTIKMQDVETVFLKVNGTYDVENDGIEAESNLTKSHQISISKAEVVKEEPKTVVKDEKLEKLISDLDKKINQNSSKKEEEKITSYLKSLKVKDHRIVFNKEKFEYVVYIEKDINFLEISAEPETSSSTIEIIGADDLKTNNYKVIIEVKDKNGDKKTYTILTKEKEESVVLKEKKEESTKIDKKYIYLGAGFLGFLLLILLIYLIVSHRENKKLDQMLNKIDKF